MTPIWSGLQGFHTKNSKAKPKSYVAPGEESSDDEFDPAKLGYRPRRPRKKWKDTGAGDSNRRDWTSFDLGRVLRVFRNADPASCKLSLRKLHLRWFHAQAQAMIRVLERAGVPKPILDMIPDIVDTCVACRAWARPLHDAQTSVEIEDQFNAAVEADLMFVYSFIVMQRNRRYK